MAAAGRSLPTPPANSVVAEVKPSVTLIDLVTLVKDIGTCGVGIDDADRTQALRNNHGFSDIANTSFKAVQNLKGVINKELGRILFGIDTGDRYSTIPEIMKDADSSRVLTTLQALQSNRSADFTLGKVARADLQDLVPGLAAYAAYGTALFDSGTEHEGYGIAKHLNDFLLNKTDVAGRGEYTRFCREVERWANQISSPSP